MRTPQRHEVVVSSASASCLTRRTAGCARAVVAGSQTGCYEDRAGQAFNADGMRRAHPDVRNCRRAEEDHCVWSV
jgi:hypothetical protein